MAEVDEYWLRRIDEHMARGNEHMARGHELMERNERAFERFIEADERSKEAFERWKQQQDEMREFMREITLRVERTGREQARAIRKMTDDFSAEFQAQRGALLAILDRLGTG